MIEKIITVCEREIANKTQSSRLAKEILDIIDSEAEYSCDCPPSFDKNIEERILEYVAREGDCVPDSVTLVTDEECSVYKVTVKEHSKKWEVPPPDFWYVCTTSIMNIYRSDQFSPRPWVNDGQDESSVVDFIKSFHIGLCVRMSMKQEEIENGSHH
jgi:hypothetical protein